MSKAFPIKLTPENVNLVPPPLLKITRKNEKNILSGIYGWCIVCRKASNSYNQKLEAALCTKQCTDSYIQELKNLEFLYRDNDQSFEADEIDYTKDIRKILSYLVRVGFKRS